MSISGRFCFWTAALLIAGSATCGARTGPYAASESATGAGGEPTCAEGGEPCDYTEPSLPRCCEGLYCFTDTCSPCGLPGAPCVFGGPLTCCPFLACNEQNQCELVDAGGTGRSPQ